MIRGVNAVADRFLSVFLGSAKAGACVPDVGALFWNTGCGSCSCVPNHRWVRKDCQCRVNCVGNCINNGVTRCVTTQALC